MPEFHENLFYNLPLTGRRNGRNGQIIAHAIVLDDNFTRDILQKLSFNLSPASRVTTSVKLPSGRRTVRPLAHLVYEHYHGPIPPGYEIDHRDLDPTNNVPGNLRLATRSQNRANTPAHRDNKSGYKGVSLTGRGWFLASVGLNYCQFTLGIYTCKHEAAWTANLAAKILHGEFARANPIPPEYIPATQRQEEIERYVTERLARHYPAASSA